jgi:hypothetical protein
MVKFSASMSSNIVFFFAPALLAAGDAHPQEKNIFPGGCCLCCLENPPYKGDFFLCGVVVRDVAAA